MIGILKNLVTVAQVQAVAVRGQVVQVVQVVPAAPVVQAQVVQAVVIGGGIVVMRNKHRK